MKRVGLISFGCAKNLIDSEMFLATFPKDEYTFCADPYEADVLILNTCGFIQDARDEAIGQLQTIKMMGYHKPLIVTGCFVQKDKKQLQELFPEVTRFISIDEYPFFHKIVGEVLNDKTILPLNPLRRMVSTPPYSAYLRISEGCDHFCAFCAIPFIRGRFRSRPFKEIIEEAQDLKAKGVKELFIVSQDTSLYGSDFKDLNVDIISLLKALDEMGFYSIRLFYLYPDEIDERFVDFVKNSKSIAHYFDLPLQSGSSHVLKMMKRVSTNESLRHLVNMIREKVPDAVIRTTFISGFSSETEEDHQDTLKFIEDLKFDHLGVFTYSREEGTAGYYILPQVDEDTKRRRRNEIMELQRRIAHKKNKEWIGKTMEGIVTSKDKGLYALRSYWNAPDDLDGRITFISKKDHQPGDIVKIKITDSLIYDLVGEEIA